jgi:hypothetical protein
MLEWIDHDEIGHIVVPTRIGIKFCTARSVQNSALCRATAL